MEIIISLCFTWIMLSTCSTSYSTSVIGHLLKHSFSEIISVYRALEALAKMHYKNLCFILHYMICQTSLQCFDTVGWAAGRASGL